MLNDLKVYLDSNLPSLWVDTYEEARFENMVKHYLKINSQAYEDYDLYKWSCVEGLTELDPFGNKTYKSDKSYSQFIKLLNFIQGEEEEYFEDDYDDDYDDDDEYTNEKDNKKIILIKIQEEIIKDYRFIRGFRDIKEYKDNDTQIIFISPYVSIPKDLEKLVYKIDFNLLEESLIEFLIESLIKKYKTKYPEKDFSYLTDKYIKELSKTACGLTSNEIVNSISISFNKTGRIDKTEFLEQKKAQVEKSGLLEIITPSVTLDDVGGNDLFKEWIEEIKYTFHPEAKKFNVTPAKGHLALGIPGTSKTFSAEALAGELGLPMFKLATDKIFSSLVGESEKSIKRAFEVAQANAPCVLLIDEVEKALSGVGSSNNSDAGTTSRVFATVLENLNNPKGVYTVMTSNDIQQLPPELLRIGRLDALWYFSLPNELERKEIISIHLKKNNVELEDELIDILIEKTDKFTGAEIEQVVKNINRKAFVRIMKEKLDSKSIKKKDIEDSIKEVNPLYDTFREQILYLENVMKSRVRKTSRDPKERREIDFQDIMI